MNAFRAKKIISKILNKNYILYEILQKINNRLGKKNTGKSLISKDTKILIDGYPRSANTFALVAFIMAQKWEDKISDCYISHHYHHPSLFIKAAKMKLPALCLIRKPEEAISSLIQRNSKWTKAMALNYYIDFYKSLIHLKEAIVFADFDLVTSNFSEIIKQVNNKFNQNFEIFEHTNETEKQCFDLIDKRNSQLNKSKKVNEHAVARPSSLREKNKNACSSYNYSEKLLLEKAQTIYHKVLSD